VFGRRYSTNNLDPTIGFIYGTAQQGARSTQPWEDDIATVMGQGSAASAGRAEGNLYFYMAVVCAVVAFAGFAPTYWAPLISGTLNVPPVIHIHGAIFFLWSLFLVLQAWLASSRRIVRHRAVGLLGVSLATAMAILGILAAISRMHWAASLGLADAGKSFSIVPLGAIAFFAITFAFAVGNARRPDWHKRLILVAATSILDAPIARWIITFAAPPGPPGPPPVFVDLGPSLICLLILAVAMVIDWRRLGRLHPAYIFGAGAFCLLKIIQVPLSETPAWHAFAGWLMSLSG
jgi:hypothetical protein